MANNYYDGHLLHELRQKHHHRWECDEQDHYNQIANEERQGGRDDFADPGSRRRHTLHHKKQNTEGGRGHGHLQVQQHQNGKPDGVIPQLNDNRENKR